MMKPRNAEAQPRPATNARPAAAEAAWRRRLFPAHLAAALAAAALIAASCQPSDDPVARERGRTLDADERYLVEYYQKILDVEENLHDNQAVREEKKRALAAEIDTLRIRRTLARLEKEPERWLAIYARLSELESRTAPGDTTAGY